MLTERAKGLLLGVGLRRGTILYTTLGRFLDLNMAWARDRALLGEILAAVMEESNSEWGILLSVLAVGKNDNMPSGRRDSDNPSGFYLAAAANGADLSDPYRLVVNEQRKVYNFLHA